MSKNRPWSFSLIPNPRQFWPRRRDNEGVKTYSGVKIERSFLIIGSLTNAVLNCSFTGGWMKNYGRISTFTAYFPDGPWVEWQWPIANFFSCLIHVCLKGNNKKELKHFGVFNCPSKSCPYRTPGFTHVAAFREIEENILRAPNAKVQI